MGISLVLNEKTYAENIESGEISYLDIWSISKYLSKLYITNNKTGYVEHDIINYIIDIIKKNKIKFNMDKDYNKVKKTVKRNMSKFIPFREIDGIHITKSEFDKIKSMKNKHIEVLMFCMLVVQKTDNIKRNRKSKFFNKEFKRYYQDLTKDSRSNLNKNKVIGALSSAKMITLPPVEDFGKHSGFELEYMDLEDNNYELLISDFRDVDLIYRKYIGENIKECEVCKRLFEYKRSDALYCKSCATKVNIEKTKENKKV